MKTDRETRRNMIWQTLGLTLVTELTCIVLRFGWQLESTRHTASTIGWLTMGIRIHHGYCGLAVILVAYLLISRYPSLSRKGLVVGWALVLSDLVHHFLVLWPLTGSPHFDLTYPTHWSG